MTGHSPSHSLSLSLSLNTHIAVITYYNTGPCTKLSDEDTFLCLWSFCEE